MLNRRLLSAGWRGLGIRAALMALMLSGSPAAAQPADTDPELKALIPDSAVAHPQDWARDQAPAANAPAANAPAINPGQNPPGQNTPATPGAPPPGEPASATGALNPSSPLPDLPGIDVAWPDQHLDLPPLPDLAGGAEAAPAVAAPSLTGPMFAGQGPGGDRRDRLASGRLVLDWIGAAPIPERGELDARFRQLSTLQNLSAKERDNLAQLAVRAASDRAVLERLLRIYGYFDAEVTQTLALPSAAAQAPTRPAPASPGPTPAPAASYAPTTPQVDFEIVPGTRYRFGAVDLAGLDAAGSDTPALRKSFAILPGDPLHSDAIVTETGHLETALGESGYPFAKIGSSLLTVDHEREEGDLALPVTPGGKYRFGDITSGLPRFLSSRHLAKIARFKPGQIFRQSQIDDLRRAILATGLVSSLTITPRALTPPSATPPSATPLPPASATTGASSGPSVAYAAAPPTAPTAATATQPGTVGIDVAMTPAPLRTISAAVGYDTAEGFRLEANWEHRNMFPPEGTLQLRGVAGTNEQLAGVIFRRNNFNGRDRVLTFDLYAQNANLTAYAARKVDFSATYERQTTLLFQKPWSWSLGAEAEASDEREGEPSGTALNVNAPVLARTMYVTGALPLRFAYDGSDNLLDPSHGWRVSLRISPEVSSARGVTSKYVSIEGNASAYLPLAKGVVLASRVRIGSILGTDLENIAPSRRFYAGGAGSIRGFGYELVGPHDCTGQPASLNPNSCPIEGGRSVYEVSGEVRFHTGLLGGALSLAPFLDSGGAETTPTPDFRQMRYGAGLGLRYESGVGPIRIDIGTPLDPHPGDSRIGVYVSLGQAF